MSTPMYVECPRCVAGTVFPERTACPWCARGFVETKWTEERVTKLQQQLNELYALIHDTVNEPHPGVLATMFYYANKDRVLAGKQIHESCKRTKGKEQ